MHIYALSSWENRWSVYLVYPKSAVIATNLASEEEVMKVAVEVAQLHRPSQIVRILDERSVIETVANYD